MSARHTLARAIENSGVMPSNGSDQQDWLAALDLADGILKSHLVVIDPVAVLVEGTFDPDHIGADGLGYIVRNVADHLDENDDVPAWVAVLRALADALTPEPPKPEEPTGLGAVVEDADGYVYVRGYAHGEFTHPWHVIDPACNKTLSWWQYDQINVVRVLSDGVQP